MTDHVHSIRPECVKDFADIKARLHRAEQDDRDLRVEVRNLAARVEVGFQANLEAIATLRERSRNWGVIGGVFSSALVAIVTAIVLAVII